MVDEESLCLFSVQKDGQRCCGHKKVSVVDFLKVRENELVKEGDIYPYEKFREFLITIRRCIGGRLCYWKYLDSTLLRSQ